MDWTLTAGELPNKDEQVLCFNERIGCVFARWAEGHWVAARTTGTTHYPKDLFSHWVRVVPPVENPPDEFAVRHRL